MWLILIFVTIVFYTLRNCYDTIHAYWLSLKINGPPALPIIGNGLLFINKTPAGIYVALDNLMQKYGPFSRFWIGSELTVIIEDPRDCEIILSSLRYIDKSSHYSLLRSWLNDGLIFSKGKKWHDRRKIITPAFHFKILERFVETFDRLGNTVIEKIHKLNSINNDDDNANANGIEFFNIAGLYALDVIGETAMGVSLNALSKPDSEYVKAVKAISQVIICRIFNVIYRNPLVFKFSKLQKIEADALQVMHQFTDDVIHKRRTELLTNKSDDDDTAIDDIGIRKKRALLDILLHSTIDDSPLTDLDIREETDNFMFAGHDTTTSAITFTLYNLAKHHEVQQKCFNEICNVFERGAKNHSVTTLSLLNQLSYLELAIKESLRLYPSVPLISRMATEDIQLTQNRIVPKNSVIMIPINRICRNPEYYKFPDAFKPERFQSEQQSMTKINPFAYIPFSAGPRNCIGQKFAMYEIKCIISKILRNFEVSLSKESQHDPVLCHEIILRSEKPIKFQFRKRN